MNKTQIHLGLVCAFILGMAFVAPLVIAAPTEFTIPEDSPCGWASLASTVTDASDDVVRYTSNPANGDVGDYHDEIDIVNITIDYMLDVSYCLRVTFALPFIATSSYVYAIFIEENGDNYADYVIYSNISKGSKALPIEFYFLRLSDGYYWSGSSWLDSELATSWDDTNYLFVNYITDAIPMILSCRIAMVAAYIDDSSYLYADFLPLTPSADSIPGFPLGFVLFGMITLLGLVLIVQRNKIWN
jgi:hypothetical protein